MKCFLAQSVQSINQTLPISIETPTKKEFIFNQLIDYVPSNPIFYTIVLNMILSFFLIQTNLKEQGCHLPNGIHIPNGWEKLVNDCQEKCFCQENEYYCIPNTCDLSKNQCIYDDFGDYCQGAVLVLSTWRSTDKPLLINLNGNFLWNYFVYNFFRRIHLWYQFRNWGRPWSFRRLWNDPHGWILVLGG